ncbi:MAG: hypothetical protein AAGF49_15340, partial [Pseudomonadota bacterium]
MSLTIADGAIRWVRSGQTEVVRGIDYLVRDENWGTLAAQTLRETVGEDGDGFFYERAFRAGEDFEGLFRVEAKGGTAPGLHASLKLTALRDVHVNRAGFVVLHPLEGVVGAALEVTHADGTKEHTAFPEAISPGQPVFDIAGLTHDVAGHTVSMTFSGDVFEMEDQRNWSDASYKTYCRPLGLPRPFLVRAGEVISQSIELSVTVAGKQSQAAEDRREEGVAPAVMLALDDTVAATDAAAMAAVAGTGVDGVAVRLHGPLGALPAASEGCPVDLEVVVPDGEAPDAVLHAVAERCAGEGVSPRRVAALPEAYLASIQPEGPWPAPTPGDTAVAAREVFRWAAIGGGVFTNFTELNRCRPDFESDFVTFGSSAIVHAADDASVLETLETFS